MQDVNEQLAHDGNLKHYAVGETRAISIAITRAPIDLANNVPLAPTGPCPKIATVSFPEIAKRLRAWKAVPLPHAHATAFSNVRSSGIFTHVDAGQRRKSRWSPSLVDPYTS